MEQEKAPVYLRDPKWLKLSNCERKTTAKWVSQRKKSLQLEFEVQASRRLQLLNDSKVLIEMS